MPSIVKGVRRHVYDIYIIFLRLKEIIIERGQIGQIFYKVGYGKKEK
jgi:hypothetical protein